MNFPIFVFSASSVLSGGYSCFILGVKLMEYTRVHVFPPKEPQMTVCVKVVKVKSDYLISSITQHAAVFRIEFIIYSTTTCYFKFSYFMY